VNVYIKISRVPLVKSEQSALALELLDFALTREYGEKLENHQIVRSEYGKPYFKNSDIFFSCSHCKTAAACAVSKSEIGVDIEPVREVRRAVIKRVCLENELLIIDKSADPAEKFIEIWTKKEAYAKFTGRGFAEGFGSIDTINSRIVTAKRIGAYYAAVCRETPITRLDTVFV